MKTLLLLLLAGAFAHPALAQDKPDADWRALVWKVKEDALTVTNRGAAPVHIAREVTLLPEEMAVSLEKTVVMPGETLVAHGACPEHLAMEKTVRITPLSAQARAQQPQTLPLLR